jgi:hypothetical protein
MRNGIYLPVLLTLFFTFQCMDEPFARAQGGAVMNLASSAFQNSGMIPGKYTCDGIDVSPPLAWDAVPRAQRVSPLFATTRMLPWARGSTGYAMTYRQGQGVCRKT